MEASVSALRLFLKRQKIELLQATVTGNARLVREREELFEISQTQYLLAMDLYVDRLSVSWINPSIENTMASDEASEAFDNARIQMERRERDLVVARGRLRRSVSILSSALLS